METFLFVIQVALWPLSLVLIGLILLQGGAGDLSSAFGGGGQLDSTLGVGAHRRLSKITGWLTAAFFLMVLVLAIPRTGNAAFGVAKPGTPAAVTTAQPPIPVSAAPGPAAAPAAAVAPAAPTAPVIVPAPAAPEAAPVAVPAPAPVTPAASAAPVAP